MAQRRADGMGTYLRFHRYTQAYASRKRTDESQCPTDMLVFGFEPGSTMKPLTVAMALESGKFTTNSVINTAPGTMRVGNHTIRDTHDYGSLTLGGIIQKSSNVGVAKIALSLPYSTLPTFYPASYL